MTDIQLANQRRRIGNSYMPVVSLMSPSIVKEKPGNVQNVNLSTMIIRCVADIVHGYGKLSWMKNDRQIFLGLQIVDTIDDVMSVDRLVLEGHRGAWHIRVLSFFLHKR